MSLLMSQPRIALGAPVRAMATLDPPMVRPGEWAVYRVTFNALEQSVGWPEPFSAPAPLEIRPGARGQVLQMLGPTMEPRTTFNYLVRAPQAGNFLLPGFELKVYDQAVMVPGVQLTVTPHPPPSVQPAQRLKVEVAETNLYVGQPVRVRVLSPGSAAGLVQSLTQVQLTGQGFVVDQSAMRQRFESLPSGGALVPTFIYETIITPIEAGKLSFFAQGFSIGNRFTSPVVVNGNMSFAGGALVYTLLDSERAELFARPLPQTGVLPGFTGAIGHFLLDPPRLATNAARVGDLLRFTVTVHSDNFSTRLVPPPPPTAREWQAFAAITEPAPPMPLSPAAPVTASRFAGQAAVSFVYALIPLTESVRATPPIPFSYFDPELGRYVDLTIPSVPITVEPGPAPGDWETLQQPDALAADKEEKEPVLSGLAAAPGRAAASLIPLQEQARFPLFQLVPALAFFGLWGWDRRRRFLAAHPEIVRRRRARRALRRARRRLRQAAQAGDAPRFAATAVQAMQVACAPYFPAEPRALVGRDVLHVLHEAGSDGPRAEVVRRFFSMTDAVEFGAAPADGQELLRLRPELEEVLQKLEARLSA